MKSNFLITLGMLVMPLLLIQTSCKKDKDPNKPLVFVAPEPLYVFAKVNDVVSFNITISSEAGLKSFEITSKIDDGKSFTQTEMEVSFSGEGSSTELFEYVAPLAAQGSSVIFTFIAVDVEGQRTTVGRRLWVEEQPVGPIFLNETSGHMMYSKNSSNADSYNLETGMAVFSTLNDSTERDIEDFPLSDTTDMLSLSWVSPAGGKFVKFNGFNYANATDSLLIDGYTSGAKFSKVDNLVVGDIILTKLGGTVTPNYVVIKITQINDPDSTNLDYYMFNVKN